MAISGIILYLGLCIFKVSGGAVSWGKRHLVCCVWKLHACLFQLIICFWYLWLCRSRLWFSSGGPWSLFITCEYLLAFTSSDLRRPRCHRVNGPLGIRLRQGACVMRRMGLVRKIIGITAIQHQHSLCALLCQNYELVLSIDVSGWDLFGGHNPSSDHQRGTGFSVK